MFVLFKKKEAAIEVQEKEIQRIKRDFHRKIDMTVKQQKKVNKILANGITLEIYHATGGKHHG